MRTRRNVAAALLLLLWSLVVSAQPPNDHCPGTGFSTLPFTYTGTVNGADNSFPYVCTDDGQHDVVFTFNSLTTTFVRVSLCGSELLSQLYVRTGGICPGTTHVTCDNNSCTDSPNSATLTFPAFSFQQYYIIVEGNLTTSGSYTLQVSEVGLPPPPFHDVCPGFSITQLPYSHSSTNVGAGDNYGTSCTEPDGFELVYNLTLACSTQVTASLCASDFDTQISVLTGAPCPGTTSVACNDDACGLRSQVSFLAVPGQTYYLVVGGFEGSTGNYSLSVTGTVVFAGNRCPGIPVTALPFSYQSSLACATWDILYPCDFSNINPDVQFTLVLPCAMNVTVSTCGTDVYGEVLIRTDGICPGDHQVGCALFGCPAFLGGEVNFIANANQPYYISVHDRFSESNYVEVTMYANGGCLNPDHCPGWIIPSLPYTSANSTNGASDDFSDCSGFNTPEHFYQLTLPLATTVTASLCGSNFDTILELRSSGACPGDQFLICNDDYCGSASQVTFQALPNVPYYLIITGLEGNTGDYDLNVSGVPVFAGLDSLVVKPQNLDIRLDWTRDSGATGYRVYRGPTPEFPTDSVYFIGSAADTFYVDASALSNPAPAQFYRVTATAP